MSEMVAEVHVSQGHWWAICPNFTAPDSPFSGCLGAEPYLRDPHNPSRLGGLALDRFDCMRCRHSFPVRWPDNPNDIMAVLAQRPLIETRNWYPGETVDDLIAENFAHQIIPPELVAAGDGAVARNGRLTGVAQELLIGGLSPRLAIEGG